MEPLKSKGNPPSDGVTPVIPPASHGGDFSPTLPAGLFDARSITDELYRVSLTYTTNAEFAEAVGLSVGYLGQVMNGRLPITGSIAAYFGMKQAQVYEVASLDCPYVAHMARQFGRLSGAYDAARDALKVRMEEDEGLLPADVYDTRREAANVRMANARATVTAHKARPRRARYAKDTPTVVRMPGETREKSMTLERVRGLVESGEALTGRQLRMAHARLKQVMNPKSGTLAENRELAVALMDRLKLKPPPEPGEKRRGPPQSPALKDGQVRRQKQALMALVMTGRPVPVSDDQPIRLAGALALIEAGLVTKVSDELSRVRGGRMAAGQDTRRMRRTVVIAKNEGERI